MYEDLRTRPVPRLAFARRMAGHVGAVALLVLASVVAGMAGYEHYERLGWRDAFLNAAMLLGGEGPVETPASPGGKVFAGLYALYSGLVFIVAFGVILTPVLHRMMHKFHWVADEEGKD